VTLVRSAKNLTVRNFEAHVTELKSDATRDDETIKWNLTTDSSQCSDRRHREDSFIQMRARGPMRRYDDKVPIRRRRS
jgi:hypothetical protein